MEKLVLNVAYILAGLSAFISFSALTSVIHASIQRWRGSDKGVSFVPLVSFLLAALACLFGFRKLWLWPLLISLLDPGTWLIPLLPWLFVKLYRDWKNHKD